MKQTNIKELVRKTYFKSITDWSKDYPEYKHARDWVKLENMVFIFFHPMGTKVTVYGTFALAFLMIAAMPLIFRSHWISLVVSGMILIGLVRIGIKIFKLMKVKSTLYEMFLKEEKQNVR